MNVTLLDTDTREVIRILDCPQSPEPVAAVMEFVAKMKAVITRRIPHEKPDEWTIELKIPIDVRRAYTPLPGDRVNFMVRKGKGEHLVTGIYQFKRHHSYVILDDAGGEWELQSMWEMEKL